MLVDERRAQLLEIGIELFSQASYDELSIDAIAKAAGVSKGLLYHYFKSKRGYYVAAVEEAARDLLDRIDVAPDGPPGDRLRAGVDAYLSYVEERSGAYQALLQSGVGVDTEVARVVGVTRAEVLRRLMDGLGLDPASDPVLHLGALGWIGFTEASCLHWLTTRAVSRDTVRDLLVDVAMSLVRARLQPSRRTDE